MSDAFLFVLVFGGLFVLRFIIATVVFLYILPSGDRCPNCDAVTLRLQSRAWNILMPWFRTSWCIACGWEGFLRRAEPHPPVPPRSSTAGVRASRLRKP